MNNPLRTVWCDARQVYSAVLGLHITGWAQTAPDAGVLLQQLERERRPALPPKAPSSGASASNIKAIRGMGYLLCMPVVVNKTFMSPHHA